MRVGIGQIDCLVGEPEANCERIGAMAREAADAGCTLVVFPELADVGGEVEAILQHAGRWDDGACRGLSRVAGELGIYLLCGLSERDGDAVYNSLALFDPARAIAARYRKVHLFSAEPVREHEHLAAGDMLATATVGDFTLGLMLCYDVRFPELARP